MVQGIFCSSYDPSNMQHPLHGEAVPGVDCQQGISTMDFLVAYISMLFHLSRELAEWAG